ncbi:ankyrin repeat domain-containing protein [Alkalimarinus sediminis]|uniref:Ankyrin repeat domain-containing protein n=1 Tax=Alkalimarinus sediminis TaxID=1632866 RepID=A0A9E8HGH6_9ALTE|nr:ankyrin repeat domain-containing protein [Alkalimarinus sediminis]UZW74235.1 hypothetical protein NNL22_14580 [Alkalimarinus sediminis]
MSTEYPYPNPFEILRLVLRAVDLKQSNKRLDELAGKRKFDPRELNDMIEQHVYQVLAKYMGPLASQVVKDCFNDFLDEYLYTVVARIPADGVNREEMLRVLAKGFLVEHIVALVVQLHEKISGPAPSFWFSNQGSTVKALLEWLRDKEPGWNKHISTLKKEHKDMVSAWARGDDLPSAYSISFLSDVGSSDESTDLDWQKTKALLLVSRAIDWVKRISLGGGIIDSARVSLWEANNKISIASEIYKIQSCIQHRLGPAQPLISELQHNLRRTVNKSNPDRYRHLIAEAQAMILSSEHLKSTQYWFDWHEARLQVFSGNIESANELYKSAFEDSLFRAGENQKFIIEEAMVVAASLPNPDRVFLKDLKWSLISFGYDIPSISNGKPSSKFSDTIEDWELKLWKSSFSVIFPKTGLFPGVEYTDSQAEKGPLLFTGKPEIKPDYRNPNRKIKVGESWKKSMPQLIWFLMNEDFEISKKLIHKGASVNVESDVGDTPILIALEIMNVTDVPYKSLDERFFELICEQSHTHEIINTRTQKKRLLPIISAVETGRPDIVKKVLELGADPNKRGDTDEQTALNVCIKRIGMIRNSEYYWQHQNAMDITPVVLDSVRRHSQGVCGFTLDHISSHMKNNRKDPLFSKRQSLINEQSTQHIMKHMKIESMLEIAKLLIAAGADVNAEHVSPVNGHTPLMLAAELDEADLFELMLTKGGDPEKFYVDPRTNKKINCWDISEYFGSTRTKNILRDIQRFFPSSSSSFIS